MRKKTKKKIVVEEPDQNKYFKVQTKSYSLLPLVGVFLTAFIFSALVFYLFFSLKQKIKISNPLKIIKSNKPKIKISRQILKDYLTFENYFYIDPNDLKEKIDKKKQDFVLVDIRSSQEYQKGHIIGAVNIVCSSADGKISDKFKQFKDKEIILYGANSYSKLPKQLGLSLLEKNIEVKALSVGWGEWRHTNNFWLPESEWGKMDINKYVEEAN